MALKTHPTGTEGVYEHNLPRVAGVEVEMRKSKSYEDRLGSRGEGRAKEKENRFFLFLKNIRGPTRFEVRTATVPRQRRQKACWVF
jgi:hypothetical protein